MATVMKRKRMLVRTGLPLELLEHKRREHLSQQGAVPCERLDVGTKDRPGDAGIADVQFGSLDQPAEAVGMPERQFLDQNDALKQGQVIADRRPAELVRRSQVGDIEQTRRLRGYRGEQVWHMLHLVQARAPTRRASVVLPLWRAPWTSTAGASSSASTSRSAAKRG